ncbi:hypothetical protein ACE1CD_34255 [Aerosakkonema sp. BLCC-F183]|uniref:hypothetical protein n=1 Tax=Aerosakkonema sp. BLCC-F183 TaxID=3342834 RepID=UPI0035B9CC7F
MARLLKRWESPRREGRNDKGRGGSARQRQLKKQQKMLRNKLKEQSETENNKNSPGGKISSLPIFFARAKGGVGEWGSGSDGKGI